MPLTHLMYALWDSHSPLIAMIFRGTTKNATSRHHCRYGSSLPPLLSYATPTQWLFLTILTLLTHRSIIKTPSYVLSHTLCMLPKNRRRRTALPADVRQDPAAPCSSEAEPLPSSSLLRRSLVILVLCWSCVSAPDLLRQLHKHTSKYTRWVARCPFIIIMIIIIQSFL